MLNMTTYYQMKERAAVVGTNGLAQVIAKVRSKAPALRLHLVGHSFGGRLVTAATDAANGASSVASLTTATSTASASRC